MPNKNFTQSEYFSKSSKDNSKPKFNNIWDFIFKNIIGLFKGFFDSVQTLVIALALFVIVYLWILAPHQVSGMSMYPTFHNGDILLADKLTPRFQNYNRGDVIIFKYDDTKDFIKRIVGMPGENVRLSAGNVYINGNLLKEPYLPSGTQTFATNSGVMTDDQDVNIPKDSYFVLGDNRGESSDSRVIGFINPSQHEIKGRVWVIYWPFDRIRIQSGIKYS